MAVLPDPTTVLIVGGLSFGAAAVGAAVAGGMRRRGVRVAYTRKLFHILVFTSAAAVHSVWALPGTLVFGSVVAAVVLGAVVRGEGNVLYDALARDSDRPHRTLFIVVPLITTALGGLGAALLAGPYAAVGYLAAGWGDAAGEPVGARWGRHPYRVPSLAGVAAIRTLEGSAAVFLVASAGSSVALMSIGGAPLWGGVLCGAVAALVEAVSNHGLDNLTVQLAPAIVASMLFG
jgi:phytol kinase